MAKFAFVLLVVLLLLNIDGAEAQRQRRKRREKNTETHEQERDITPEEVIEITEDKQIEDDPDELAKKAMMEEWDQHMSDFVPDDMLTVELGVREEIVSTLLKPLIYHSFLVSSRRCTPRFYLHERSLFCQYCTRLKERRQID